MSKKIGILGGGQLGRMFLQVAYNYPFDYAMLDADGAPCQALCQQFHVGDFNDYDNVMTFGEQMDVIGIEIEHVNTEALAALEAKGKTVIPSADTLTMIKDKGLQKQHYDKHSIATPAYYLIENADELDTDRIGFPFVQKLRTGGYDGKGVQVIANADELDKLWSAPSVIETFTPIAKEIAVMVVKGQDGSQAVYPAVEMVFDEQLNLVDYLFSPAHIRPEQAAEAERLAKQVADSFAGAGIFAVELFIDTAGKIWVNETAPRVHNSGHHTIEAAYCSQFEQLLRVLGDLPLGNTALREPAAMINLVGAPNHQGEARIAGLDKLAALDNTFLHWYGKTTTSPGRKMGHVTVLGDEVTIAQSLQAIKKGISIITN
ncbi:MAG: 5-(carboxyamino)imidazole ribonucleotide synthase [Gammaproteobacteria bacterium]|nr:MAG: 5-(carboxyamino)imidazole ribonucleotide synthase [Gammaproteobacteria bacterium]